MAVNHIKFNYNTYPVPWPKESTADYVDAAGGGHSSPVGVNPFPDTSILLLFF